MSYSPKANIQVGIRVRPLLPKERANNELEQWIVTPTSIAQKDSKLLVTNSCYSFNCVFNDETETATIYERLVKPMVASSLEGYNVTIFAYGQTSSGKTYTIRGEEEKPGLISLAINDIYKAINESSSEEFTVRASYMEIYNEVITDLLEPSKGDLDIHESLTRGVFVDDLTERSCHDSKQLFDVFNDGEANRKYGSTIYNEHSSRSHTVFRILLSRKKEDHVCKMSILNFVDLAGSERAGQGGAQGIRLKEAGFINKSLLTLGKVISELSKKQSHISFRESKLTRLLSSSLGGNSQTCILCTVSPNVVEETHLTLQFADRAMTITNRPKVNEVVLLDEKEMKLRYLTQENEDLKQQIKLYQSTSTVSANKESEQKSDNVPTILGSMRFFKKRAEEYFDELQKEKKLHSELLWEVEKVHTRNADFQALNRKNQDKIQELEDQIISLQQKHATELSFTLREQERNIAELITYDDMESVTKQLEEEYEKNIKSTKAEHLILLSAKDKEIKRLTELCDTKSAELEILEENYKNKLALKQTQIQRLQDEHKEQASVKDLEELEQQKLTIQQLSEKCEQLSHELEQQASAYQQLEEDWNHKSSQLEEQKLHMQQLEEDWNHKSSQLEEQKLRMQRLEEDRNHKSTELEEQKLRMQQLEEDRNHKSKELEEQKLHIQTISDKCDQLSNELEIRTAKCQQLQKQCNSQSAELEEQRLNVQQYRGEYNDQSEELEDHKLSLQKITDRCEQVCKELESKNDICQQLQEEYSVQSAELEEERLNVQRMTEKYDELSKELEIQTGLCQQYQAECNNKSTELKDYQLNLQTLTEKCHHLSNELENKNSTCQLLQEECSHKGAELEKEIANVQRITEECDQLSKELEAQTAMYQQYKSEYNNKSMELKDQMLSFQKLEKELADCKLDLKQGIQDLENCQSACVEAEEECDEANDKIEALNQKLEEDKEVIANLQNTNEKLDLQLKEQLEKYNKLEVSNKELSEKLKEYSEMHPTLGIRQKDILLDLGDEESEEYLKTRVIYLDNIIERLKKENSGFKRDARDWEMEAKKLRKQKSNLEFKVECLEASCKSQGQPHSYTHERLKEQVGVVEAGMYWDMRRDYTTMEAEKENAMAEFERMKQEVLRVRKERDVVLRKYKALKEANKPF